MLWSKPHFNETSEENTTYYPKGQLNSETNVRVLAVETDELNCENKK